MEISLYQVDAFTDKAFGGNPAAVCPLESWLDAATMQAIAAENNLSETAFFVNKPTGYDLRWFTPTFEIDLCGHATLASAYVIFEYLDRTAAFVDFQTKSGLLTVTRQGDLLSMDFPARPPKPITPPQALLDGLGGAAPQEVMASRDAFVVYENADQVRALAPDPRLLKQVEYMGVIATAPGDEGAGVDFVSRFFAPNAGIDEDPVTGSSHSTLIPYWAERLGKDELHALQISKRGGELWCRNLGARVAMAGRAALYMKGTIFL